MQCYRPVRISNRKLVYKDGFDKPSLYVPCGKCEACRVNLQNDWTIRAYFHWRYYQSIGGCTLFITNTYRQNDSPIYGRRTVPVRWIYDIDSDNKVKRYNFMCFDKSHIDTYINSVRKYFRRKYGIGKNSSGSTISYLVCCEYGSHGTVAPHYHILFFFPPMPCTKSEIKKVCDRLWSHGFSIYSLLSNGGAFVNNPSGIKYVAKYCTKDMAFYGHSIVQKALNKDYSRNNLKNNLPRHWQSQGFGKSMVDWLTQLQDPLLALLHGVRMNFSQAFYNVPMYVRNKILFDIYYIKDSSGNILHTLRKFSKYGYDLAPRIFDYNLDRCKTQLENDLSVTGFSRYFLDRHDLNDFLAENPLLTLPDNSSYLDVKNEFKRLLGSASLDDLAKYSLVYRGFTDSDLTRFRNSRYNKTFRQFVTLRDFSDSAQKVYLDRVFDSYKSVYDVTQFNSGASRNPNEHLTEVVPEFRNFETILVMLDLARQRHSQRVSCANISKQISIKNTRDQFLYNY